MAFKKTAIATATRRAATIEVAPILTDRDALESVLSPAQVDIVETIAADVADHGRDTDSFKARTAENVKALWPKGCDWDTWKTVRGVFFATFGEYGARCLRDGYDAADIGDRPTSSGNASGNSSKGKMSGTKWVSGMEKRAADMIAYFAKCPKREVTATHVAKLLAMARSLVLEAKATRKDLAA